MSKRVATTHLLGGSFCRLKFGLTKLAAHRSLRGPSIEHQLARNPLRAMHRVWEQPSAARFTMDLDPLGHKIYCGPPSFPAESNHYSLKA